MSARSSQSTTFRQSLLTRRALLFWIHSDSTTVGDVELSAARRLNLGSADENPLAGDVCDPYDVACDGHLDVVAASPDRPARPARSREFCLSPLAGRLHDRAQHFASGAGPLGVRVAGRREACGAMAETVSPIAKHAVSHREQLAIQAYFRPPVAGWPPPLSAATPTLLPVGPNLR